MAVEVQYRYGSTTEHTTFTGVSAELTVDTTKHTVVVHDGLTAGGYPLAKEDLSNVPAFVGATASVPGKSGRLPVPAAGDQGKVLYGNGTWGNLPTLQVTPVATATYTLVLADAERYLRFTATTAKTITIPDNATAAFAVGTTISGISVGSGQLTLVAASGVTINTPEALRLRNKEKVSFVLTKVAANEWDLAGDLEAV